MRVCEGPNSMPESKDMGKVIVESLSRDTSKKMKAKAVEAVGGNGSYHERTWKIWSIS